MADKDNAVDFKAIAEAHSLEKDSNSLTKLPEGFFERAVSFIKASYADLENKLSEGVPDKDILRRSSENQRSREILESIYNTRERKVILMALNASRGIDHRTENMTENEKDLFFNLKVELENKRDRVLRYDRMLARPSAPRKETGIDTTTDDFAVEERAVPPRITAAMAKMSVPPSKECVPPRQAEAESQRTGVPAAHPEGKCLTGYVLVKALSDVGPFACGDGLYVQMVRNDIATLPEGIASVLVSQGMAQVMEAGP